MDKWITHKLIKFTFYAPYDNKEQLNSEKKVTCSNTPTVVAIGKLTSAVL